eukprot:CAMPEP_0205807064 /NCGR_PEP_ID=MMETSP0205-20121125/10734_1 /ASSEMBLY_ACC=CAM_ASM_000278 /TAXON_ID=36767 /ORGANISM="Euplotes focardii, Strain TN1" /LENGTH=167 /DNA_ID=CAMNT_0053080801 /DNA_START=194 /DNA_END=694 /DNA_ORIENTATION=-
MNKVHWKKVALKLMDILAEYPASKSFWYSEKREKAEYEQKETYSINMAKIKKKLEFDIEFDKTNSKTEGDEDIKYTALDDFLSDLLTIFRNTELFVDPEKMKYKYSQACQTFVLFLLQDENIFLSESEKSLEIKEIEESMPVAEIQEEDEDLDLEERERKMNEQLES